MNTILHIRDDFSKPYIVQPSEYVWTPSPQPEVTRMMLDRIGNEVARATTIVRYEPNSCFPAHVHRGGEEFLVLDGIFSDEHNPYPKGFYVRNPTGTRHAPKIGSEGATIFVKLHQFPLDDKEHVSIDTLSLDWILSPIAGVLVKPLHTFRNEKVALVKVLKGTQISSMQYTGGFEILVLEGSLNDNDKNYPPGTWMRYPDHYPITLSTQKETATVFIKTGHLPTDNLL